MIEIEDKRINNSLLENKSTPKEVLEELLKIDDRHIQLELCKREDISEKMLKNILNVSISIEVIEKFKSNDIYVDKEGKMILNIRDEDGEITGVYQVDIKNNREVKLLDNSKEMSEEVKNFISNKVIGIEEKQEQTEEIEENFKIE